MLHPSDFLGEARSPAKAYSVQPSPTDQSDRANVILKRHNEQQRGGEASAKHSMRPSASDREHEKLLRSSDQSSLAMCCTLYTSSTCSLALFVGLSIATLGLVPLATLWWPWLYPILARRRLSPSDSLDVADFVLVQTQEAWEERPLHHCQPLNPADKRPVTWFTFRTQHYVWVHETATFEGRVRDDEPVDTSVARLQAGGWTTFEADTLHLRYGPNSLDIEQPTAWTLLGRKVAHPFYLFQIMSIVVWLNDDYISYALVILLLSTLSIMYEVMTQVQNGHTLARFRIDCLVSVVRNCGTLETVHAHDLVVGDIVCIGQGIVPADIRLVRGTCIVDESSLTGEAVPVVKQVGSSQWSTKHDMLSAGTTVLQHDSMSRGCVTAIGFATSRGQLFRSVLYPPANQIKFERDSYRFLAILVVVGVAAAIHLLVDLADNHVTTPQVIVKTLDILTVTIPPALPLVLTVGIGFALARLHTRGICCIDASTINFCGGVTCVCFDKTGTLTCDEMEFVGVHIDDTLHRTTKTIDVASSHGRDVLRAMATCHSLAQLDALVGHPLELAMVQASGYAIHGNRVSSLDDCVDTVLSLPFDPTLQRATVVVHDASQHTVFSKGAPDTMRALCHNYSDLLAAIAAAYTARGHYCLALAAKSIDDAALSPSTWQREALESNLTFLAFLLFKNPVKPNALEVVRDLHAARVDVRMLTGDNVLTAIHVCRELEMTMSRLMWIDVDVHDESRVVRCAAERGRGPVEPLLEHQMDWLVETYELAVTGPALALVKRTFQEDSVTKIVDNARIFAAMRPDQKTWVVERLMHQGLCVAMCGDGANDCGALKAAHVGLALSDTDASIVAPFTSRRKDIHDVITLLQEGRCALTTSFLALKYMFMYPIIQLVVVQYLYSHGSELSNNEYLADDLGIVLGLSMLMLNTSPASKLSYRLPPETLYAPSILCSLLGHIGIFVGTVYLSLDCLQQSDWYCSLAMVKHEAPAPPSAICYPYKPNPTTGFTSYTYENSVLWFVGHMQYVILALAFNVTSYFRQPFYSNGPFVICLLATLGFVVGVLLSPETWVLDTFQVVALPQSIRRTLLYISFGNTAASVLWEVIATKILGSCRRFARRFSFTL
ncbi:Aste57867_3658 [Aphanomyces stellatus]|uniref:Aste57867_3658 protein n=1 Tax=Aphanomyces stellatus TaxID=120398 RepID=A0A485KCI5_9STRA|nr:hypothetical protein As57867_003647 [Aphanomyces stellatus]VFT80813.1 Aste57867_3658 [Aphanomyces stellatus]